MTVLVVDDQESVRTLVTRILEERDARVIGVPDGRAALDAMAEFEDAIDVVLTDIVMPGISGIELARRLRAERPGCRSSTSRATAATARRPTTDRCRKPFTPEQLVTAVGEVLPARFFAGR